VHGLSYPESFLPLAEEIGLMVEIGRLVLDEAAGAASSWRRTFAGCEHLRLNVNLAPSELHDPRLVTEVAAVLERSGLEPQSLVLEITESGVMRSPDHARAAMQELRRLGVSLALDDFGTGHSSLAHLREFPLDSLKIAREFVAGLPSGHVDRTFVETIVRMGDALGLEVIAEGIESEAQASCIASLGCRLGQGYYFGEPVGGMGVTRYLTAPRLPADAPFLAGAA
jgi:EAL domain-containing protein (putative c-di-GMP-specific phosphodiesterase class I)